MNLYVIYFYCPQTKFDKSMLHRRPEFDDSLSTPGNVLDTSAMAGPSKLAQNASSANSVINGNASVPKVEGHDSGPLTTLQPHVRPHATGTPVGKSRMPIVQSHSISNAGSGPHPGVRNTPGAGQTSVPNQAVHNNQQIRAQRQSASRPVPPPQPPQSVQLPPPQPNKPQPQAHAPSANSAPTVPDMKDDFDSFMFNSDDDAFLAGVDLGEGDVAADLGRPIDSEEGVGGAIDFDEGAGMELGVSGIGLASSAESNSAAPVNAVDGQNHVRFASGGSKSHTSSCGSFSNVCADGTNNFNKPDIRTSSAKHPAQTTGASTGMHPPPRPSISHANNQGPQSASDASRVKENVDSSVRPGPAAQPHGQNRPQAPVGGFHFPPGIVSVLRLRLFGLG
ncbi:hypothetical protein BD410DRAFT_467602 [Rickenella mellea]|uniref:Uncharacterized protein n=1 Tax=Rickenella mellea TaxID=50990 RepID=A0A4Y7PUR7_9AGAM|nr:hypothetical protein BD410DRAFT_467602 [Rickenella mellea]